MASFEGSFPTVRLFGNGATPAQVMMFGTSRDGSRALVCMRVPMEERHLDGGTGGGRSKVSLVDEKGQPKLVLSGRMVDYCAKHKAAWLSGGCPECKKESEEE